MIENLKFFKDRLELAGPDGYQMGIRSKDRTVIPVKKWMAVSAALRQARADTMTTLTAKPGKGGAVVLEVADKERFTALQEQIAGHEEQLKKLEGAIMALDELGPDIWYSDIEDMAGSYGRVEFGENTRLSNLASATLARRMNTGKPSSQILAEDDEYQRFSRIANEQIADANKQLAILRPKLESMKVVLESVGC